MLECLVVVMYSELGTFRAIFGMSTNKCRRQYRLVLPKVYDTYLEQEESQIIKSLVDR